MKQIFKIFLSMILSVSSLNLFASNLHKKNLGNTHKSADTVKTLHPDGKLCVEKLDSNRSWGDHANLGKKKKIIIFTSTAGGGHIAVAQALSYYLRNDFEVMCVNIYSEVIQHYEPLYMLSCGYYNSEKMYNALISRKYYKTLSYIYRMANMYTQCCTCGISKKIKSFLAKQKPDLVISVIPFINRIILNACEQLRLPFLLIPTDFDITTFIENIKTPTYENFRIALPSNDALTNEKNSKAHILKEQSEVTGFALRADFFEEKDSASIKKKYDIPGDKPVILLMLGAQGSDSVLKFVEQLAKIKHPAHVIVCLGKRDDLRKKVSAMLLPKHISCTMIGFTDRVSDLLAVAHLCITKSGSVSVAETMHMNVPMILDATTQPIIWEEFNHQLVERNKLGRSLKKYEALAPMIDALFSDPKALATYKKNLRAIIKKNGGVEIQRIVHQMLDR